MVSARKKTLDDLPPEWAEELSDDSLRDTAGLQTYERGLEYLHTDRVQLLSARGLRARFEAHGSALYTVDLHFEDPGLHADCSCPHAADGNFCKHMVAAAMLWRGLLGGDGPVKAAPKLSAQSAETQARTAKAAATRVSNREAVRTFLASQPAEQLAQRLWERAEADRDLMAELKAWAASAQAADDPKALRTAVDALLKTSARQYLERREVRAWTDRATKAAALLRGALPRHAADVRAIAESAIQRALAVDERSYDSQGEVDGVIEAMMALIIDSLRLAPPPPTWADHLLQRMEAPGGTYWQAAPMLEAAGPEVARAYSKRLVERWQKEELKSARKPDTPMDTADMGFSGSILRFDVNRDRLRRWLFADLQRQADPLAVFEFLKRSAQGVTEHAELIRWCNDNGRLRDALLLAQTACKTFKNHPHLEDLLLDAYERDGWDAEALAIRLRRFDQQPSPDNYRPLAKAAAAANADWPAIRRRAYAQAQALEQKSLADFAAQQAAVLRKYGSHAVRPAPAGPDVSWRAGMLVLDGAMDEALALVHPPNSCDPRVLEALADKLGADRSAEAFALLRRCFDFQIGLAKTPYKEPLRLLAKALTRLNSQDAKAYLLSVGNTHRVKRNFIAGLPRLPA